jgi:general secretion pathway protein E
LGRSSILLDLADIGFGEDHLDVINELIRRPHGILLVTGPTGSGKSTTLYACLAKINSPDLNILTVEDPVEYQLEGISQTQVNSKIDLTFASGLRSFLRQDPDVIMVGEIRDAETASMAIQSALTGHLVFSTLHTNDAASAVTRLLDLGIEPYLVASSLIGVMAQRLVRKVCEGCASPIVPTDDELTWLGIEGRTPNAAMRHGRGCDLCRHTGYRGRLGIFELLSVNEPVRRQIQGRMPATRIKAAAVDGGGMCTLRDDGVEKVLRGVTTIGEVERVTSEDAPGIPQVSDEEPEREVDLLP